MEQTAVDWLIKEIKIRQNGIIQDLSLLPIDDLFSKAKMMENNQMNIQYEKGYWGGFIVVSENVINYINDNYKTKAYEKQEDLF
jgi:hypothetical protein